MSGKRFLGVVALSSAICLLWSCTPGSPKAEPDSKQGQRRSPSAEATTPSDRQEPKVDRRVADETLIYARSPNGLKVLTFAGWGRNAPDLLREKPKDLCDLSDPQTQALLKDGDLAPKKGEQCKAGSKAGQNLAKDMFAKSDDIRTAAEKIPDRQLADLIAQQADATKALFQSIRTGNLDEAHRKSKVLKTAAQDSVERFELINRQTSKPNDGDTSKCDDYDYSKVHDSGGAHRASIALGQCDPGHFYCSIGDRVILGTSGNDVLIGSPKTETICGLGGNDIIVSGGGAYESDGRLYPDEVYGGPGNDQLVGSARTDALHGNDGDDVIIGKNACFGPNLMANDCSDLLDGDSSAVDAWPREHGDHDQGNDVVLGGAMTGSDYIRGGPGNDLLAPTPISTVGIPLGNDVEAGDGNDLVFTLNFLPKADQIRLKKYDPNRDQVKIPIPIKGVTACVVTVPLTFRDPKKHTGSVKCSLPWSKKLAEWKHLKALDPRDLKKLKQLQDSLLTMNASVGTDGKVSVNASAYNSLATLSGASFGKLLSAQAGDSCVCDPLKDTPPISAADGANQPWDYLLDNAE